MRVDGLFALGLLEDEGETLPEETEAEPPVTTISVGSNHGSSSTTTTAAPAAPIAPPATPAAPAACPPDASTIAPRVGRSASVEEAAAVTDDESNAVGEEPAQRSRGRSRLAELEEQLEEEQSVRRQLEEALQAAEEATVHAQQESQRLAAHVSQDAAGATIEDDDAHSVCSVDSCDSEQLDADNEQQAAGEQQVEGEQQVTQPSVFDLMMMREGQRAAQAKASAEARAAKMKHLPLEERPSELWDLGKFQEMEKKVAQRRNVQPHCDAELPKAVPKPRKGRYGAMNHFRHGLVGAVKYWARGSQRNVERLLLKLIREFGAEEAIREALFQSVRRDAATDKAMVDRYVAALDVLKACQTEQQRRDYLFALSLTTPPRAKERSHEGMARRVAARCRVSRGKRSKKRGERPYAFEKATDNRTTFDIAAARFSRQTGALKNGQQQALALKDGLKPGEKVLTHNGPAELARFTEDGGCVVIYRIGDDFAEHKYNECYSKAKGSARLRPIPPSLTPPPREERSDSVTDATRLKIRNHFATKAPISPHQRDVMRRRVGPFVVSEKPGHIMSDQEEVIYEDFIKAHPEETIKPRQYKYELPWNRKHAYRETCLDRVDLNFEWHRQGLQVMTHMRLPQIHPPTSTLESTHCAVHFPQIHPPVGRWRSRCWHRSTRLRVATGRAPPPPRRPHRTRCCRSSPPSPSSPPRRPSPTSSSLRAVRALGATLSWSASTLVLLNALCVISNVYGPRGFVPR